jgi:hypothetical protein
LVKEVADAGAGAGACSFFLYALNPAWNLTFCLCCFAEEVLSPTLLLALSATLSFDAAGVVEGDDPDDESEESEESVDESERCTGCGEQTDDACEICGPKCESCHLDMRTDEDGCTYCDKHGPADARNHELHQVDRESGALSERHVTRAAAAGAGTFSLSLSLSLCKFYAKLCVLGETAGE